MRSDSESDTESESPPFKRQRLSSPTYDEQFEMFTQEEVEAVEKYEMQLSQATAAVKPLPSFSQGVATHSLSANPISSQHESVLSHAQEAPTAVSGFQSAASLAHAPLGPSVQSTSGAEHSNEAASSDTLSSSPAAPQEQDFSDWFQSKGTVPPGSVMFRSAKDLAVTTGGDDKFHDEPGDWFTAPPPPGASLGFQTAKLLANNTSTLTDDVMDDGDHNPFDTTADAKPSAVPAFVGFQTSASLLDPSKAAKKTSWSAPSAEALAKAAERMKQWEAEIDKEFSGSSTQAPAVSTSTFESASQVPAFGRVVLKDVENAAVQPSSQPLSQPEPPDTPTPIRTAFKPPSSIQAGPSVNRKPFKSPLLTKPAAGPSSTPSFSSPLNPNRRASTGFKPPSFTTPLKAAFPSTPGSVSASPTTKTLGVTPRRAGMASPLKKPAFVTPFKPGMKPGDPGRAQLDVNPKASATAAPLVVGVIPAMFATPSRDKGKGRATFCDLTPPADRKTLCSSGFRPQSYTREELESYGINYEVLSQMTPETAQWYRFYATPPPSATQGADSSDEKLILGPEEAFEELKARGCKLATLRWVENHWGLILWKLAGLVALDPHSEASDATRRWCWGEVLRQLLYRYERELNGGARPPLRLIAAQDKPAGLPLVLCISSITWPTDDTSDDAQPEVEMTDGWYRVRVEVDAPISRAIRRGALRAGMKVGVVGAKLLNRRAEPFELLENPTAGVGADASFALVVSGNGCHLAPWHAKLGFQGAPFVATLGSLTPDGGLVPVLDVTIVKTFPIAYIEFYDTPDGKSWSAPMKEPEEMKAQDAWNAKRDAAVQRIRDKMEKFFREWEKQADRLEIRAGLEFKPRPDDSPPDTIDDLLCAMEDALTMPQPYECPQDIISRTSRAEAGWLAQAMRQKLTTDRENMADEIEKELQTECPPRKVRNFRVVVVEDSETRKRPKQLQAQVTIWDVLTAYRSEDGVAGDFRPGERFLVTNLEPNNTSAWMPRGDDAEIYLIARRDTRWRKVKVSRAKTES